MEKGPRFVPTKKEVKNPDCMGGITLDWAGRGGVEDNDLFSRRITSRGSRLCWAAHFSHRSPYFS